MALQIKGNGKLMAIWLVVTIILACIGGAATGALVGGAWPGRVVGIIGAACSVWLVTRLSKSEN